MSRQEAERVLRERFAKVSFGEAWTPDESFSALFARVGAAALADAGLLADPADTDEYDECFFCGAHNADEPGAEAFHKPLCLYVRAVMAGTPEEQTPAYSEVPEIIPVEEEPLGASRITPIPPGPDLRKPRRVP